MSTDTIDTPTPVEDSPPPADAGEVSHTAPTPDAPYGRTEDGTLLDRNGRRSPYGLSKSGLRRSHQGRKVRRKSPGQGARPTGSTIQNKRRKGIVQLLDVPKGVLLGLGYKTGNDAMLADAVTIDMHAPVFADALAQTAEDNDQLARVIDKLIDVGPMAALGMAAAAFLAQVARNHNALPAPVASMLGGSHDPAELAQVARGSMEAYEDAAQPAAA